MINMQVNVILGGNSMADVGAAVQPAQEPAQATAAAKDSEIRIYAHSPIIYWWVVWAYGFFCALLTYAQGDRVVIGGAAKGVLMHPSPWLGISFTALVLFVVVSTSVKARGFGAVMLVLLIGTAGAGVYTAVNSRQLFELPPTLLIHMNLAFYLVVSSVLLLVWL